MLNLGWFGMFFLKIAWEKELWGIKKLKKNVDEKDISLHL